MNLNLEIIFNRLNHRFWRLLLPIFPLVFDKFNYHPRMIKFAEWWIYLNVHLSSVVLYALNPVGLGGSELFDAKLLWEYSYKWTDR